MKSAAKRSTTWSRTYKVVLGLFPVEAMYKHGQDVAGHQHIYHQGVLPKPLHGDGGFPAPIHVHLKDFLDLTSTWSQSSDVVIEIILGV
jgi:hypothetical protein